MLSPARGQGGFTLVELVVALTVLAVGIASVVNVFWSSFAIAGQGNNRSRAVALATRETEAIRAVPYDRVGFSASQSGFSASFEGATTVLVDDPLMAPTTPSEIVGGVSFSFVRHIVWADAASVAGFAQAYKRAVVLVSWTDQGGTHTVRQDAYVYPGGEGVYTGPQGGATTTTTVLSVVPPVPPLSLTASVPSGADGATTVDLAWTASPISVPAVAAWVVQYSTDAFITAHVLTDTQPSSITSFTAGGLSPATTYQFRVAARESGGLQSTWSVTATATTTPAVSNSCSLGTATLTPSAVKRLHGVATVLASDVMVNVNTSGVCSGLQVRYSPLAGVLMSQFLTAASGGTWMGTMNGITTAWDTGVHHVDVLDGAGTVLGSLSVTVCVHNAKDCP